MSWFLRWRLRSNPSAAETASAQRSGKAALGTSERRRCAVRMDRVKITRETLNLQLLHREHSDLLPLCAQGKRKHYIGSETPWSPCPPSYPRKIFTVTAVSESQWYPVLSLYTLFKLLLSGSWLFYYILATSGLTMSANVNFQAATCNSVELKCNTK